jgi:2-polyprenyl-3-methyl-5-hydroxy-6-metoxy-1,4-benzoquinol methylase
MEDNFYDRVYYQTKPIPKHLLSKYINDKRREIRFLNTIARLDHPGRLLDIGCGVGDYLESVNRPGIDPWGIDISKKATDVAKTRVSKPEQILCSSAPPLPFEDNSFEYVTAWGVIEHFPSIPRILQEIHRITKPGASIFIMVPNLFYYTFIWNAFKTGRGPIRHQEPEQFFAFQEWKHLLEHHGLRIKTVARHNKFNKSELTAALRTLITPFYLSNHFIFTCEPIRLKQATQ